MMQRVVFAVVLLCMTAGSGFSQPGPGHRTEADRRLRREMKAKLNLTEEQEGRIDRLRTDHLKNMVQLRAKVQEARIDLIALRRRDDPDKNAIETAIRNISGLKLEMKLAQSGHHFAVRELLTPEQRKTFREGRYRHGDRSHLPRIKRRHDNRDRDE